jgi:chorismate-pyruvate lyase
MPKQLIKEHWMSRTAFYDYCKTEAGNTQRPHVQQKDGNAIQTPDTLLRLLLLSDGTMTRLLEGICLTTIGFELAEQFETVLSDQDAKSLSLPKGEKAIKRQGWLTQGDRSENTTGQKWAGTTRRLVHVMSILPTSILTAKLHHEILLGKKPLGQIIHEQRYLFRRDDIEIGQFFLPDIAKGFGLTSNEPLWARRYQLALSNEISGLLFETISPSIASSAYHYLPII